MPRPLQDLRIALRDARREFVREHDRVPTVREVAGLLHITEEQAGEVIGASDAYRPVSLSAPLAGEEDTGTLADLLGGDDPALDLVVDRNSLRPMLRTMPERERTILMHRFFGNLTQAEIAELMGISQMHVSRLITRSLATLRARLLAED